jgi:hypothetical protein
MYSRIMRGHMAAKVLGRSETQVTPGSFAEVRAIVQVSMLPQVTGTCEDTIRIAMLKVAPPIPVLILITNRV